MSAVDPPVDPPGAPPRNTPATTVSARFHTLSAYVARVSRATMPAGSARPNGPNGPNGHPAREAARVGSFGISPLPSFGDAFFPPATRNESLETRASTSSRAWNSCAAIRAASRKRNVASGARVAAETFETCASVPSATAETTPIADHTLAIVIQSMTQHAAMTRLNARAEPHTAASRHCPATSASAYRIRRHRFASGGGSFGAGRPPSRLARVARRIAVVSLRATATATSSNTRHRVSDASRPIQFATDAGHANANPAATRGSANATAPLRFAVCAATTHTRNMSSTRNALRSRRARRRARRASGKPSMREERFAIRDVFGKGATERAHVSATSAACALSDAAPSAAASARAPRVHATIVAHVSTSVTACDGTTIRRYWFVDGP